MQLVGYLCEDYHDARSLEHKVRSYVAVYRDNHVTSTLYGRKRLQSTATISVP
jgi:hypothetical protein